MCLTPDIGYQHMPSRQLYRSKIVKYYFRFDRMSEKNELIKDICTSKRFNAELQSSYLETSKVTSSTNITMLGVCFQVTKWSK